MLALLTVAIVIILAYTVRTDNIAAGSLRLDTLLVCEDIDDDMTPIGEKNVYPGDIRQVCLWFEFSRGRDGDQLDVTWQHEGENIQKESFVISQRRGSRVFFLIREDGSELLEGHYTAVIRCNGKMKGSVDFIVEHSEFLSDEEDEVEDDDGSDEQEGAEEDSASADITAK